MGQPASAGEFDSQALAPLKAVNAWSVCRIVLVGTFHGVMRPWKAFTRSSFPVVRTESSLAVNASEIFAKGRSEGLAARAPSLNWIERNPSAFAGEPFPKVATRPRCAL